MPDDFHPLFDTWQQEIAVGDIVLFRFPMFDPTDRSEARPRPCLVSDVAVYHGATFVELVPGLPGAPLEPKETEIVADWTALIACAQDENGLMHFPVRKATRFDATHPGFVGDPDGGSPHIGRLHGTAREQLELLRARREASRLQHLAQKQARKRRR